MIEGNEIKKIQQIELEIFEEIIRICAKYNIEYFIIGGTVLGAIRHEGFIPWDDDIDVGMTRNNYNRFLEIAQSELKSEYFLQNFMTDLNSPTYFSKVRKNDTKFVEYCNRNIDMHHGIFVDIFPYDNVPDNIILRKRQLRKVRMLYQIYIAKSITDTSVPQTSFKGYLGKRVRFMLHFLLKPIPKYWLFNLLDKELKKYNNIGTQELCYIPIPALLMKRKILFPLKTVKFDRLIVSAPNDCHAYLASHFGDYMKLPPVEKRVGHRPYILEI